MYLIMFYTYYTTGEWQHAVDNEKCVSPSNWIRPLIMALPAWFRFAQCLRRYRDTRDAFPHLVNAGKYSTTFFVILFSTLYAAHNEPHRYKHCLSINLNSSSLTFPLSLRQRGLQSVLLSLDHLLHHQFPLCLHLGHQDGLGADGQQCWREQVPQGGDCVLVQEVLLLCHHRRLCPPLCLGHQCQPDRGHEHPRILGNHDLVSNGGVSTICLELFSIGKRTSEQLRYEEIMTSCSTFTFTLL